MAIDRKISLIAIAAIVVIIVGGILHIVALASPYWHVTNAALYDGRTIRIGNYGLWVECSSYSGPVTCTDEHLVVSAWLGAVRAMVILGMLCGSGALVMMGLYTFIRLDKWSHILKNSAIGSAITAGVLILIGAVIYGVSVSQGKYPPYLFHTLPSSYYKFNISWSFGLSVTGAIFCIVSGILIAFAKKPRLS